MAHNISSEVNKKCKISFRQINADEHFLEQGKLPETQRQIINTKVLIKIKQITSWKAFYFDTKLHVRAVM